MNSKIALTALSFVLVLGGASGALAAKKHNAGHEAYASGSAKVADPRVNKGANHETWCDMDAKCNGWDLWLEDVGEGKLKAE